MTTKNPSQVTCKPCAPEHDGCDTVEVNHPVWHFDGNTGPDDSQRNGWYVGGCLGPFSTQREAECWKYAHECFCVRTIEDVAQLRERWALNIRDEDYPGEYYGDRRMLEIAEANA